MLQSERERARELEALRRGDNRCVACGVPMGSDESPEACQSCARLSATSVSATPDTPVLQLHYEDGEFEVWLNPDHQMFQGLVIGHGPTARAARQDAVETIEAVAALLKRTEGLIDTPKVSAGPGEIPVGGRVQTPFGPGVVQWLRKAPPDYVRAESYSVRLDAKAADDRYAGTIVRAADVQPLPDAQALADRWG